MLSVTLLLAFFSHPHPLSLRGGVSEGSFLSAWREGKERREGRKEGRKERCIDIEFDNFLAAAGIGRETGRKKWPVSHTFAVFPIY